MKWYTVKEKFPPLNKHILLGIKDINTNKFEWFKTYIKRPFEKDKKYNPDYFIFVDDRFVYNFDSILEEYHYWMEIDEPAKEQ
jgi:hypothetical protein